MIDFTGLAPAPTWMQAIKHEVGQIARHSRLVQGVANGERESAIAFWAGLWPFDVQVGVIVLAVQDRLVTAGVFTGRELAQYMEIVADYYDEESTHNKKWAETLAKFVSRAVLNTLPVLSPVMDLIASIGDDPDLARTCLKMSAVEMVAEESCKLMATAACAARHGGPVAWIEAHLPTTMPYAYTHENIAYQMAQRVRAHEGCPAYTEQECRDIILATADLFWTCGEAAYRRRMTPLLAEAEA